MMFRFSCNHTNKRNVTEELPSLRAPTCLLPQSIRCVWRKRARSRQHIGAAIDQCEHIGRLDSLRVTMATKASHLKPDGCERSRKTSRQPWIVDEVRHHRAYKSLERIEVTYRNGRRRVVAIEYGQPAVWTKYAVGFAQRRHWVGYVAQRRVKHHQVERGIIQSQRPAITLQEREPGQMLSEFLRSGDKYGREVDPGDFKLQ